MEEKKKEEKTYKKFDNYLAIMGFIFSITVILSVPGLIVSIFALIYSKDYKYSKKELAIAGIIISSIIILSYIGISMIDIFHDSNKNSYIEEKTKEDTVCATFMVDDNQYYKKCGERGFKVDKPKDPTKEGYEFKYWSTKKDSTTESDKYDFDLYVNIDKTFYSVFVEKPAQPINNNQNTEDKIQNSTDNTQSTTESTPQVSRYETIYNQYSARLRSECPNLSITECATISNEGVQKMAEYMFSASGTDGQYATYESWAMKLYNVYIESAR